MICLKNIDVIRFGVTLLRDFSWNIQPGENWLITGPNGSGKTLLLEALAGRLHLPKGEIQYDFVTGRTWGERYAEKRDRITYIPAHALHQFLNGNDEVYYQQRYYSVAEAEVQTARTLLGERVTGLDKLNMPASLSVDDILDVPVARLSNGQLKKLLLLKRLLNGMPKLLLLDYPFEGLDGNSREDLCQFIDFLVSRHGVQVIIIDQHHHLPSCMNRKLTMEKFSVIRIEKFDPTAYAPLRTGEISQKTDEAAEAVIRIHDLQLKVGDRTLFNNFNWRVNRGERWALTGRNGSGKTTLFSLIFADHPQAYAQKIHVFGKRRGTGESIWDIKRRINYLGPEQISYLNPKAVANTAYEYIRSINKKTDEQEFGNLIKYFSAGGFMHQRVTHLSSGQLQLLMIINCFLSEKELLLLDEPFQFLDGLQKSNLTHYLLAHLKQTTTMILITHYEADVRQWTDRRMEI